MLNRHLSKSSAPTNGQHSRPRAERTGLIFESKYERVDSDPSKYLNYELSWLKFNFRVLNEALDPKTPLLERVKFIGIVGSNLDEFFQKRVGGLKRQLRSSGDGSKIT